MGFLTKYWMLDTVFLLSSLVVLAYLYMTRKFKYWKRLGITEIAPTPFVGNFGDCLMTKRSSGQWLQDLYNYSSGLPFMGFYIFDKPCLLIRDPELVKSVLIRDFSFFQDRFARASPADSLGNSNLFLIKNPAWKELRTKLTPIYTSGRLKKMFELMVEVGDDLDAHMSSLNVPVTGIVLEWKEISAKFTTDMIATTAFGLRANSLSNPDAEFREAGKKVFAMTAYRNFELTALFFMPEIVKPLGLRFITKETAAFLRQALWGTIMERERTGAKRNDLIDILVELRKAYRESPDKGEFEYDGDNLVAQATVFFTGGFETSSTTTSFTLYELATHPEIQRKLRAEIVAALEQSKGKITYDMTMNLPYLDMVVAETLRMYPPLPFLDRVASEDYQVPNSKLLLKKGTPVFISMTGIHFDPQYYPNPLEYDPERFSAENKRDRKACTYFPFGEGPHICIGMRIGLLQTKLALIKLLPKYEFSPCDKTLIPMRLSTKSLVTAADGGIFLNVKKIPAA